MSHGGRGAPPWGPNGGLTVRALVVGLAMCAGLVSASSGMSVVYIPSQCRNGVKDTNEAGIDCGGLCPVCSPYFRGQLYLASAPWDSTDPDLSRAAEALAGLCSVDPGSVWLEEMDALTGSRRSLSATPTSQLVFQVTGPSLGDVRTAESQLAAASQDGSLSTRFAALGYALSDPPWAPVTSPTEGNAAAGVGCRSGLSRTARMVIVLCTCAAGGAAALFVASLLILRLEWRFRQKDTIVQYLASCNGQGTQVHPAAHAQAWHEGGKAAEHSLRGEGGKGDVQAGKGAIDVGGASPRGSVCTEEGGGKGGAESGAVHGLTRDPVLAWRDSGGAPAVAIPVLAARAAGSAAGPGGSLDGGAATRGHGAGIVTGSLAPAPAIASAWPAPSHAHGDPRQPSPSASARHGPSEDAGTHSGPPAVRASPPLPVLHDAPRHSHSHGRGQAARGPEGPRLSGQASGPWPKAGAASDAGEVPRALSLGTLPGPSADAGAEGTGETGENATKGGGPGPVVANAAEASVVDAGGGEPSPARAEPHRTSVEMR